MKRENNYLALGKYAQDLIRSKARTLIGQAGFTSADCDDIEQELALDLLVRLEKFNPKKSRRNTFMARVVDHRAATLIEERLTIRRDWRVCQDSLDDPEWQQSKEGIAYFEERPDLSALTRDGLTLKLDFLNAAESLPEELRELCHRLLRANVSHVARDMGMARATLYYRIQRLREALRDAGL